MLELLIKWSRQRTSYGDYFEIEDLKLLSERLAVPTLLHSIIEENLK